MNAPSPPKVAKLKPGIDIRSLPLSAVEGFVLSRIDGTTAVADLAGVTGLDKGLIEQVIERLVSVGAVVLEDKPVTRAPPRGVVAVPSEPARSTPAAATPGPGRHASPNPGRHPSPSPAPAEASAKPAPAQPTAAQRPPASEFEAWARGAPWPPKPPTSEPSAAMSGAGRFSMPPPASAGDEAPGSRVAPAPPAMPKETKPLWDPKELEEDVDLDVERRRTILDTFYTIEGRNHYEMLGVSRGADKKVVRKAYFDLAKVFHPDTMFRKRLGAFKSKMEVIFKRITEAYELLNKKELREEYDQYLALTSNNDAFERGLADAERIAASLERGSIAPSEIPTPSVAPSQMPPASVSASQMPPNGVPATRQTPTSATQSALPPPGQNLSQEERRKRAQEMMQRMLLSATGRKLQQYGSEPPKAPQSERPKDSRAALNELTKSLKQVAGITGGSDKASRHLSEARRLESKGDIVAAANSYRLAMAFGPDRPEIAAEYERVRKVVAVKLAENYARQAEYEEKFSKIEAAAVSWGKVCDGRPDDVHAHRKVAECLLHVNGDMRRAQKYAQRAVDLEGKDARNHKVLGRVYLAAGLRLNAKRELEVATKLDPNDELVKNLLKEIEAAK